MSTPKKRVQEEGRARKTNRGGADWRPVFLTALRNSGNVRASCQAARVSRVTVYDEREINVQFAKEWDEAKEEAIELLEATCRKRALQGSDVLMIFLLKAHRPELYRERFDLKLNNGRSQDIVVDLVNMSEAKDD